jgi:hypothetical protein
MLALDAIKIPDQTADFALQGGDDGEFAGCRVHSTQRKPSGTNNLP